MGEKLTRGTWGYGIAVLSFFSSGISPAKLCSSFVLVNLKNVKVLFVLRFYHPNKTNKINLLIPVFGLKMAVMMSSVVKQEIYTLKLFRVAAGCIYSFRIHSLKQSFRTCIQSIRF